MKKNEGCALDDPKYFRRVMGHLRRVWMWSPMRREALKRAAGRCDGCGKKRDKLHVDHIVPVAFDKDWVKRIKRLFVFEQGLQILCSVCHQKKTNWERESRKKK